MRQLLGVLRAGIPASMAVYRAGRPARAGRQRGGGVIVTLRAGEVGEVPAAVSQAAYRVVQEALTNVVKHGGGSRVTVEVAASGGAVLVTVEDDADQASLKAMLVTCRCPAGPPVARRAGRRGWPGRHAGTRGRLRR